MTTPSIDPVVTVSAEGEAAGLVIAEYQGLRAEILKIIELQSQLVSLAVIAFGAVLSIGFETKNPVVVLVYPILAGILQVYWLNYAYSMQRIARYMAEVVEPRMGRGKAGWETYIRTNHLPHAWVGYWGVRVIFVGSASLTLVAAPVMGELKGGALVFYIIAILITAVVAAMSILLREPAIHTYQPSASEKNGTVDRSTASVA